MAGQRYAQRVALADVDEDLVRDVPAADRPLLRRALRLRSERAQPGPWDPGSSHELGERPFAVLVIQGLLAWDTVLGERASTVLLGPGDVVSPWTHEESLIPFTVRWTVLSEARLMVLDARFALAARRWPGLLLRVAERQALQAQRAALDAALTNLPNTELRVLGTLWHLADRWGRVGEDGVLLPLRLTHEALGRVVGAERPTVSLALRDLTERGLVQRRADGGWLLRSGSQNAFAASPAMQVPGPLAGAVPLEPLAPRATRRGAGDAEDLEAILASDGELRDALAAAAGTELPAGDPGSRT
jgi:CRP-like cAMP-binding protein